MHVEWMPGWMNSHKDSNNNNNNNSLIAHWLMLEVKLQENRLTNYKHREGDSE